MMILRKSRRLHRKQKRERGQRKNRQNGPLA
nr:MAG TPA: hypothetical protein [Caudoviricetes sp.]